MVDYIVCYYISEYVLQCYNGVWSNLVEERKKICHWKIVPLKKCAHTGVGKQGIT